MSKSANQKLKLLHVQRLLTYFSDEEHPLSIREIISRLEELGIPAERKSVYSDLETLAEFGLDVQSRKGQNAGWFVGQREFELAELKLLVDAVQSARFLTRKKSDALIRKLESLASVHQARQLQRQVFVQERVKLLNEGIYYNVDKLHAAIAQHREITFRYFDYDMYRKKQYRHEGQVYTLSPYGLIWNSENYYLVAYHAQLEQMRHYRVDKMDELTVTESPRRGERELAGFDIAAYAQKHFGMFSGREVQVTLLCRRTMAGVVLDRFGQDVILVPRDEEHFTVTLPVVLSPQFFGWLFGLEDHVILTGPEWAVEAYRQKLSLVGSCYKKEGVL